MKKLFSVMVFLVMMFALGIAHAGPISPVSNPTGPFEPPISDSQTGPQCSDPGYDVTQYHMHYDDEEPNPTYKYHVGDDLNGKCGGSTDENYPLRAIADGKVVYLDEVDDDGKGKRVYIRYSFPYAPGPNDVQTFDSAYFHINGVNPSKVWWSGPGTGSTVSKGDTVAYLGGTGGWVPHLHWEAQWDDSIPLSGPESNPYQNPLTITHALKYRAPSLIVDDRRDEITYTAATGGYYTIFTMPGNAPSSTAYMEYSGERKSLKKAITAGWMENYHLAHEKDGLWYYYYDIDNNFFENGHQYAISANVSGAVLHILVPCNAYQDDRARIDMIHAVESDPRFSDIQVKTFGTESPWSLNPAWDIRWMRFKLSDGRTAYVNQVTYRANPLIRNTAYYDPDLGQWTNWQWVDWNQLY